MATPLPRPTGAEACLACSAAAGSLKLLKLWTSKYRPLPPSLCFRVRTLDTHAQLPDARPPAHVSYKVVRVSICVLTCVLQRGSERAGHEAAYMELQWQ